MSVSDFDFYAGLSPEKFLMQLGVDPYADGYNIFWFRAEDIPPISDGYQFDSWPDAIRGDVSPYRLYQSDPTYKLQYYSNMLNGYPVVGRGTGLSMFMTGEGVLFSGAQNSLRVSSYIVHRKTSASGGSTILALSDTGTTANQVGVGLNNGACIWFPNSAVSYAVTTNEWQVTSGRIKGSGSDLQLIKKNNLTRNVSSATASVTVYNYRLCLNTANGTTTRTTGGDIEIAEMIFINGIDLTDDQHSIIVNTLCAKYNIPLEQLTATNGFQFHDVRNSLVADLNENLSPSLGTEDGYFVRAFVNPDGVSANEESFTRHLLNDSNFIGIDNTQAVSTRASLRVTGLVSNGQSQVVLVSHLDEPWKGYGKDSFVGYGLKFGTILDDGYGQLGLRLAARDNDGYADPGYPDILCTGTYEPDTWYRVRLDVIPVGSVEDRLTAYVGTGVTDEEIWVNVGSVIIPSSSTVYRGKTAYNRIGYFGVHKEESGSNATTKYYIDRFQVRRKII